MLEAPDIFVSYASKDRERVRPLVETLRTFGYSVWWDRELKPGETWDEVIGKALLAARCVVVAWSANAVASDWVRIEAEHARQRGVLVPVYLEIVPLPIPLDRVHTADLSGWNGEAWHTALQDTAKAIREKLAGNPPALTGTGPAIGHAALSSLAPAPSTTSSGERIGTRSRILDAAIGSQLPVNRPADLIIMVRRKGSDGLAAILSVDTSYSARPEDVRSSGVFMIEFPRDAAGRLGRAILNLKVHSPDFQVSPPEKRIAISPEGDSSVYAFLVTPLRSGPLLLNLDLFQEDVCLASRVLRPSGVETVDEPAPSPRHVVSITLPLTGLPVGLDLGSRSTHTTISLPDGITEESLRAALESIRKGSPELPPSGRASSSSPVSRSETRGYGDPWTRTGGSSSPVGLPGRQGGGCLVLLGLLALALVLSLIC